MINEINDLFKEVIEFAERNQTCLRKAVGCAAITFTSSSDVFRPLTVAMCHNGPSRKGFPCSNEVGNCGCSHAEPRTVQSVIEINEVMPLVMICTYSPCTNCANIIIDSGLFSGIIYQILTEHDKRGDKFLREAMPVITVDDLNKLIEEEACAKIKQWISD